MECYLTTITYRVSPTEDYMILNQLVKATTKESARQEVEQNAIDCLGSGIVILEIKVSETLIGK